MPRSLFPLKGIAVAPYQLDMQVWHTMKVSPGSIRRSKMRSCPSPVRNAATSKVSLDTRSFQYSRKKLNLHISVGWALNEWAAVISDWSCSSQANSKSHALGDHHEFLTFLSGTEFLKHFRPGGLWRSRPNESY